MVIQRTNKRTARTARPVRALAEPAAAAPPQGRPHVAGEVALGVAHDLANMMGALQIRIELLQQQPHLRSWGVELDALARTVKEGAALVAGMQALYPVTGAALAGVDLGRCVAAAVAAVSSGLRLEARVRGVELHIEQRLPRLPRVRGREPELRRLFVDIMINVRDAMPGGGRIAISGGVEGGRVVVRVNGGGASFAVQLTPAAAAVRRVKAARSASRAAGSPR
jgi:signal transduction histidine kinase